MAVLRALLYYILKAFFTILFSDSIGQVKPQFTLTTYLLQTETNNLADPCVTSFPIDWHVVFLLKIYGLNGKIKEFKAIDIIVVTVVIEMLKQRM